MGARGPVPNHSADLARPRDRKGSDQQPITKGTRRGVVWPPADPEWHSIALMLWDACQVSGQADFYQQTDIAFLYSLCEDLTRFKEVHYNKETGEPYFKRSGQTMQAIYSAFERLLIAEGDRRRVRLELEDEKSSEEDEAEKAVAKLMEELGAL